MKAINRLATALQVQIAVLAALLFCVPAQAKEEGWDWMVEPYVWAAGINAKVDTAHPPLTGESTQSFSDLINKMDGVFQARVEGRNDKFGVFVDFTYLSLAGSRNSRRLFTDTDLDMRLMDAAVSWRPAGQRYEGLDLYTGIRYLDTDLSVHFASANSTMRSRTLSANREFVDFLVGARYQWQLSDKWQLALRGDASGGSTKGTWGASIMVGYNTKSGIWLFGYRHLDAKFSSGQMDARVKMSGPQIGYAFIF